MDPRALDPLQLDALREAANIGAGHAATALSQITEHVIMVQVPDVRILPLEEVGAMLGDPAEVVCAVIMRVFGDVTGRTVQIFPATTAVRITAMLMRTQEPLMPEEFGTLERSAIKEIGNILGAAYLNALHGLTGLTLTMSAPAFAIDMAAAVLTTSYLNFDAIDDHVLAVTTHLGLDGTALPAHFLLIPDEPSLQGILAALRVG
jgi:chemotaxis protein CheC